MSLSAPLAALGRHAAGLTERQQRRHGLMRFDGMPRAAEIVVACAACYPADGAGYGLRRADSPSRQIRP